MKKNLTKKRVNDILDFILSSGYLKGVKRTGWVIKGVENVESVADHTWRVALLAMLLADNFGLNKEKLVSMALIHDLGETGIGDIKWEIGARVIASQEDKHRDEEKSVRGMIDGLEDSDSLFALWREFNNQRTPEAKFLKQLDKLEMVFQALEYQQAGYPSNIFDEFWENAEKYLKGQELEDIFLKLREIRGKV